MLNSEQKKRIEAQLHPCSHCGGGGIVKTEKVNPENFYVALGTCKQTEELYFIQCEHCKGTTDIYHDTNADGSMIRDWEHLELFSGIGNRMIMRVGRHRYFDKEKRKWRKIKAIFCERDSRFLLPKRTSRLMHDTRIHKHKTTTDLA